MIRMFTIAVLLPAVLAGTARAEFWGSASSNRYHFKNCQWVPKIRKENLVHFDSADKAVAASYLPCEKCRPPLSEKHPPVSGRNAAQGKHP